MDSKPKPPRTQRLYLSEHRKARGISPEQMALVLGIERESVHRLEREQHRLNPDKIAAFANALGVEPEELWRAPGHLSIDVMIKNAPARVQAMAVDIVRRLVTEQTE